MHDQLHRFTFEHFGVRGEIVSLAASWRAMVSRQDYQSAVRDYLGQALVAATLLSGTIKFKGSLILQLQGDGPLRTLVAYGTDRCMIRSMAHTVEQLTAGALNSTLGTGQLAQTAEAPNAARASWRSRRISSRRWSKPILTNQSNCLPGSPEFDS